MDNEIVAYEVKEVQVETTIEKYQTLESDLNDIQNSLTDTAEKLTNELPKLIEFASAAEHPKVYEALSKIVMAISTVNRDAAAVVKQKKELYDSFRKPEEPKQAQNNDNRSIHFHGSSSELLDRVLGKDKE